MIISGGVNIYPQETENLLITHPRVADAAVIGVPNADFGEEVKAVVQPLDPADATPQFAEELMLTAGRISARRSEEHTSELQSLMRTSYAVFCLKKKTYITTIKHDLSTN